MCAHVLSGQGQSVDIDLLQDFIGMLHVITDSRQERSYNRRLYRFLLIVLDLMSTNEYQHKRRKMQSKVQRSTARPLPQSDYTSPQVATSDIFTPFNGNTSPIPITPQILEAEDQNFECATFPLFSSMAPMDSEWAQSSSDDTMLNIANHVKGLEGLSGRLDSLAYGLPSS